MVDIRRRIRNRSHLQTGSGHGGIYFRSVPEVDLNDLRVCSQSQVAGSYVSELSRILLISGSTIAELSCALHMDFLALLENLVH